MKVLGIIWLRDIVDKLSWKHNVTTGEVEEVFERSPRFRFVESGDIENENLYAAYGQSDSGRYLIVFFILKASGEALIISARDMTKKEKKSHGKK